MALYNRGGFALENEARALEASDDYRVLRRLPQPDELWLAPTPYGGPAITIAAVDTETTGLSDRDTLIEIAIVKISLDHHGRVCDIKRPIVQLEDPLVPLSAEVQRVTGLDDATLAGRHFDEQVLIDQLDDVDALVAFNARFDAGFWRRRFPAMRHPWLCALRDYSWVAAGFNERSQSGLLTAHGHFYVAHRAEPDAWALAMLLAGRTADERTVAAHLVDAGRRVDQRIAAWQAPFSVKDDLRARGYRWDAGKRVWMIDVAADLADVECAALMALHPGIRPAAEPIDWFNRHVE